MPVVFITALTLISSGLMASDLPILRRHAFTEQMVTYLLATDRVGRIAQLRERQRQAIARSIDGSTPPDAVLVIDSDLVSYPNVSAVLQQAARP